MILVRSSKQTGNQALPHNESLFNYFKGQNENINNDDLDFDFDFDKLQNVNTEESTVLNSFISKEEIINCVHNLKNNKASGLDGIINEYISSTIHLFIDIYVHLFNLVLDTGKFPEKWLEGIIKPIYKNKGDPKRPENYRPITLLSCFGKLFTSVINNRLQTFIESNSILSEAQAGFRKGYSTNDHVFTLYSLAELLKARKKKLFCTFVDLQKAFDTVWRSGLWQKLLQNNISGKCFNVIYNMYQNIKSCVSCNDNFTCFFSCKTGVRQGENLSPILFAIFLNDLEQALLFEGCEGVKLKPNEFNDRIENIITIFMLLYADDAVLLTTNVQDMQNS